MIPDLHIPGVYVEYFLIYWILMYIVYVIISGVVFGVRPLVYTFWQPQVLIMVLFLPLYLPFKFWRSWREYRAGVKDAEKAGHDAKERGRPGP